MKVRATIDIYYRALPQVVDVNAMVRPVGAALQHPPHVKPRGADAAEKVGRANQPVLQEKALGRLGNGAMPPKKPTINDGINDLFKRVCQQEARLKMAPAAVTACTSLPPPTGAAASVVQVKDNAVDVLLVSAASPEAGPVAAIDPADSRHRGGGLALDHFPYENIPLEEMYCSLGLGGKASMDGAAHAYPLGIEGKDQNQLYINNLQFRHDPSVLHALRHIEGSPRERLAKQRDLLLGAKFSEKPDRSTRWDMVCIAAPDRRKAPDFNKERMRVEMLAQFANAMIKAKEKGVRTFIMSLPGSALFAKTSRAPDAKANPDHLDALAAAAVDATRMYGHGLKVVIPSHGQQLDERVRHHLAHPTPVPTLAPLKSRTMGGLAYTIEPENLATGSDSEAAKVLRPLIGDGSKASLHRVRGIPAPSKGEQPYWFIGRDPDPRVGRALVSIQTGDTKHQRQVYALVFSLRALPKVAELVSKAKAQSTPSPH